MADQQSTTTERPSAAEASNKCLDNRVRYSIDLQGNALHDRETAIGTFIECHQVMESAVLADAEAGPKAFRRLRAAAVNETLGRHLTALDAAIAANSTLARDAVKGAEAAAHLAELRARACTAAGQMEQAASAAERRRPSAGPGM